MAFMVGALYLAYTYIAGCLQFNPDAVASDEGLVPYYQALDHDDR